MKPKLIQQGAEAKILLKEVDCPDANSRIAKPNKASEGTLVPYIVKDRIKKSYRLEEIDDKIRKHRTKKETKLLEKASEIIPTPVPKTSKEKTKITMPYIKGKKLSENLDNLKNSEKICEQIGIQIAKLHEQDIIHGDLTTSNMILAKTSDNQHLKSEEKSNDENLNSTKQIKKGSQLADSEKLYFIDFGLGFHSTRFEDRAVDLHLIRQALEAKHFKNWQKYFKAVLRGYKKTTDYKRTLEQLKKVESRGRYKKH